MSRKLVMFAVLAAAPTAVLGQILMPGGVKPVAKPSVPVMAVPVTPVTTAPVGPVTGSRTIELLKGAGIVTPVNLERTVTLGARTPYIDDATTLSINNGDLYPQSNSIYMKGIGHGMPTDVWLRWNPDPSKRYVIDCAFKDDGTNIGFGWDRPSIGSAHVTVNGGRAGVVLPVGTEAPVMITSDTPASLRSCDITPFGS